MIDYRCIARPPYYSPELDKYLSDFVHGLPERLDSQDNRQEKKHSSHLNLMGGRQSYNHVI